MASSGSSSSGRYREHANEHRKSIEEYKNELALIEKGDYSKNKGLQKLNKRLLELKAKGDLVLINKFKCTYTIMNPLFKATQEITRVFYLSKDNTKVFGAEDVK